MVLGRNFPPTVLRWTAENVFPTKQTSRSLAGVSYNLTSARGDPDGSGIFTYGTGNGVALAPTAKNPRNWNLLKDLYLRSRCLWTRVKCQLTWPSTDAANISWNVYWWVSSNLDIDNPVKALNGNKTVGTAPYEVSEVGPDSLRVILDSSRRVMRKRILSSHKTPGTTVSAMLPILQDRMGNRMIGGHHIINITNAPGGVGNTTDKLIAAALAEPSGVGARLNVVAMPTKADTTTGHNLTGVTWTITNHMEFYSRVLPPVVIT